MFVHSLCFAHKIPFSLKKKKAFFSFFLAQDFTYFKDLQMVSAAMKLKDAYSLEEKLWPT